MPDNFPKSNVPYSDWNKGTPYKKHDTVYLSNILDNVKFSEWTKYDIGLEYRMVSLGNGVMFNNVSRREFIKDNITAEFDGEYNMGTIDVQHRRNGVPNEAGEKELIETTTTLTPSTNAFEVNGFIGREIKIINDSQWPVLISRIELSQFKLDNGGYLFNHNNQEFGPRRRSALSRNRKQVTSPTVLINYEEDAFQPGTKIHEIPLYMYLDPRALPKWNEVEEITNVEFKANLKIKFFQDFLKRLGFDTEVELDIPIVGTININTEFEIPTPPTPDTLQYILIQKQTSATIWGNQLGYRPNEATKFNTEISQNKLGEEYEKWGFEGLADPLGTNIINYLPQGKSYSQQISDDGKIAAGLSMSNNNVKAGFNFFEGKFLNQPNILTDEPQDFDSSDSFLAKNIEEIAKKLYEDADWKKFQWDHLLRQPFHIVLASDIFAWKAGNHNDLFMRSDFEKVMGSMYPFPDNFNFPQKPKGVSADLWREDAFGNKNMVANPYNQNYYHQFAGVASNERVSKKKEEGDASLYDWITLSETKSPSFDNVFFLKGFGDDFWNGKNEALSGGAPGATPIPYYWNQKNNSWISKDKVARTWDQSTAMMPQDDTGDKFSVKREPVLNTEEEDTYWPRFLTLYNSEHRWRYSPDKGNYWRPERYYMKHYIVPSWDEYQDLSDLEQVDYGKFTPNIHHLFYNRFNKAANEGATIGHHHFMPLYFTQGKNMGRTPGWQKDSVNVTEVEYGGKKFRVETVIAANFISNVRQYIDYVVNPRDIKDRAPKIRTSALPLDHPCVAYSITFEEILDT